MTSSAMLVCSFYLKKRFSREADNIYNLNQEIVANGDEETKSFSDVFELISSFCDNCAALSDEEKYKKMFSVKPNSLSSFETTTYRAISFTVQSGSYGIEADMTNRRTRQVGYHRTEDDADVKSFICVVYVPKDTNDVKVNKGIFVFQSIATYGVKTITVDLMRRFFSELGLTLETRSVSVKLFLEKLIDQGALSKITFISNNVSPNPADNIFISTGREERSFIKPRPHQEWLKKILDLFDRAVTDKMVEIPDGESFDDVAFQFNLGGRTRTIRLKALDKLSIVEEIPDGVIDKNDNSKIINHMISTAEAYKQNLVFIVSGEE